MLIFVFLNIIGRGKQIVKVNGLLMAGTYSGKKWYPTIRQEQTAIQF